MLNHEIYISPRESAKFIAENSKYVKIHEKGIIKLAEELISNLKLKNLEMFSYVNDGLHPTVNDSKAVDWIFAIDTLNFCFWTPTNKSKWSVNGHTGYYGLTAAFKRALQDGFDIINPKFYTSLTEDKLEYILRPDDGVTKVPLIPKRLECLHEVGNKLLERYNGSFENCIKEANHSAVSLLKIILENFPCYRDESVFEGKRVSFYKRAQILVSDLWSSYSGKGWGEFYDFDKITMFADYRVPQVLVHFGVLEYHPEIINRMKHDEILDNDSRIVNEIRGCSIHAIELVNIEIKKIYNENNELYSLINSPTIDYFLWLYRRRHADELNHIPYHKVLCHFY